MEDWKDKGGGHAKHNKFSLTWNFQGVAIQTLLSIQICCLKIDKNATLKIKCQRQNIRQIWHRMLETVYCIVS